MKLAVLSDIHGNLTALEAALQDLDSVGEVDEIWVLGDLSAFGPHPARCIERLQDLRRAHEIETGDSDSDDESGEQKPKPSKVKIIGGNTDRYIVTGQRPTRSAKDANDYKTLLSERVDTDTALNWCLEKLTWEQYDYLNKLIGREVALTAEGYGRVIGYHAIPGNDETVITAETPEEEAADALLDREGRLAIGGHIHQQMDRQAGRWRMINVGSVGLSFDMPGKAQWGLFTFADGEVQVDLRAVPYDVEAVIDALAEVQNPSSGRFVARLHPES